MNYYRSKITGMIITEKTIRNLYDIYGKAPGNVVDVHIMNEVLEVVNDPSLEDCIRYGNDGVAIIRFRELNENATFEEAKSAVKGLRQELKIPYKTTTRKKGFKNKD